MEEIKLIADDITEFLYWAEQEKRSECAFNTESFNALEGILIRLYWKIRKTVSDDIFIKCFPMDQAIRINTMPWGLHLRSYPALARKNNNCWAVNYQMYLWERYFELTGLQKEISGHYLAAMTYCIRDFENLCNTVEAHALLNGLTLISYTEDSPKYMDLSVRTEQPSQFKRYFEICLVKESHPLYQSGIAGNPINWDGTYNLDGSVLVLKDACQRLQKQKFCSQEEIMEMYRLVSRSLGEMRMDLLENDQPLRMRKSLIKASYQQEMRDNPFSWEETTQGDILIKTNAGLRNREIMGSHYFEDALNRFLTENKKPLTGAYRVEILRKYGKRNRCDHDNTPFESIYRALKSVFNLSAQTPLIIRKDSQTGADTCIRLVRTEQK